MSDAAINAAAPGAAPAARPTHPLFHAGKWLLSDVLSTLAFVALYSITKSIYVATGFAIALGVSQIAYAKFRGQGIDVMQWLTLGLVIVFGGAALLTRDPRFIMVKPTLIYAAVGCVMLKPGWMNRYVTPPIAAAGGDIVFAFGYIWSGLMFATAGANLIFAIYASPQVWAWFLGVFPLGSKLVMVPIQYLTMRVVIRRRIRQGKVSRVGIA